MYRERERERLVWMCKRKWWGRERERERWKWDIRAKIKRSKLQNQTTPFYYFTTHTTTQLYNYITLSPFLSLHPHFLLSHSFRFSPISVPSCRFFPIFRQLLFSPLFPLLQWPICKFFGIYFCTGVWVDWWSSLSAGGPFLSALFHRWYSWWWLCL